MPSHSLSKLLCLFSFTSFFLTATCLADELPQDTLQPPVLLNAETYGVKNGLSQNTVTSFTEDNDGYMWFGTLNGLNRFDGKDFKHFYANDSNGLENSFIRSLIFTEKFGGLLIGTDSGLYTYKKDIEHFVKTDIKEKIVSMDANDKYLIISTKDSTYKLSNINTILEEKKFISNDIKKQLIIDNTIYTLCHSGILYADQREIETGIT
ncbi:hypothetical protein J3L11_16845, partial [Shewanella sp. 4t3-1-2LB]|uniref:ligand-binding sensor domain-containing protein n=1 Tax=Shewanella sp. 4t3-1-2LB TaxID=2817682 RepID=UPI001ACC4AA7